MYRTIVDRHSDAAVTSFLDPDGLVCLRMRAKDRETVIAAGGAPVKQYGGNLADSVSAPDGSRDVELDHLFSASWDYAASLKPK